MENFRRLLIIVIAFMTSFNMMSQKVTPVAKNNGNQGGFGIDCALEFNTGCQETYINESGQLMGVVDYAIIHRADPCAPELSVVVFDENGNILGSQPASNAAEYCSIDISDPENCDPGLLFELVVSHVYIPISLPFGCEEVNGFNTIPITVKLMIGDNGVYDELDSVLDQACLENIFPQTCLTPNSGWDFTFNDSVCYRCSDDPSDTEDPGSGSGTFDDPFDPRLNGLSQSDIQLYPNPVADKFYLNIDSFTKGEFTMNVISMNGEIVKSLQQEATAETAAHLELDASTWPAGIYWIKIDNSQQSKVLRLIKL